ncbi:MAG: LamG-like jellyroll fold domain-containing protein [Gemmatimonadota bacterium]
MSTLRRIFAVAIALTFGATPAHAQLLHRFDFSNGLTDLGNTASSGSLYAGATVSGGVLNLNGLTSYVEFTSLLIPQSGPYSVMFLAESAPGNNTGLSEIISQGQSGSALYMGTYNGGLRLGDQWPGPTGTFLSDNAFHHYALTNDGTLDRFYIDGDLIASHAATWTSSGWFTRLGRQYYPHDEYYNGQVDEVRIYGSALSETEIEAAISGEDLNATPEPSSVVLLATGFAGLCVAVRRRTQQ